VESQASSQDHVELSFTMGVQNLRDNRFAVAISAFSEVLGEDPEFYEALALRAIAYVQKQQYPAALQGVRISRFPQGVVNRVAG
jgi:Tfp pilus assembly protein PilF